ncbi:hypothetical protein AWB64_04595 [Caballeronia sordidicola]|uniref:S-adenosylhomocysteine hydrolase n=2 Tax=Caballeronia sordidicola TaxID=196367 RepID=A0A158HGS3_CABSO|nr:hypothetical protein AWB64_04595 [Caballeronia sordidicola]
MLLKDAALVRVGHGIYAKTRWNRFAKGPMPAGTFEQIAAEACRKLGIQIEHGQLARDYNAGLTTQILMVPIVSTGSRRITRTIQVGTKRLLYERNVGKASRR